MANYTAADIKALRESTGAGMLDVKKALDEADGDAKKATEIIRVKGLKGITKREGRSASDGLVAAHVADDPQGQSGVLIELNCETDFVTKSARFIALAEAVLTAVVASGADDVAAVLASDAGGRTVAETIDETAAVIGEKLVLRRVARVVAPRVTVYLHKVNKDLPPQIGEETSRNEGKPEAALPKIAEARLGGFFKENVLVDQAFAKDQKKSVAQVLAEIGGTVTAFARFRVGA